MRWIINIAVLSCIFIILPSLSFGDSVDYFYDDNGRLVKASNDSTNTRLLYQYDEVGNLISIFKETSTPQALPPVLQSIDPDIFIIGESYNVVITGQNLLTTESVTSDNPDVTVKFITAIDTKIIAVLSIADTATPGQTNITVTTSYGSASIPINLYGVNISPNEMTLFPTSTALLSVNLIPSASKSVSIKINNNNHGVVETPSSVVIPDGGNASFTVTAIRGGTAIVKAGTSEAVIYVIGEDEDSRGAVIESSPVSISIGDVPTGTVISSMPVSVNIGYVPEGSVVASMPVSVNIGYLPSGSIISSNPVSVQWLEITNGIIISQQVSVEICSALPVMVSGTSTNYYSSSLQTAYDNAAEGDIIKVQTVILTESVNFNRDISVTLEGGYDCDFMTVTGKTGLKGTMRTSGGTVKVKNFILKK